MLQDPYQLVMNRALSAQAPSCPYFILSKNPLGDAVKELFFLKQVWRFMLPDREMSYFPVFEDNQGAGNSRKIQCRTQIEIHPCFRQHFFRGLVRQGDISVNNFPSDF